MSTGMTQKILLACGIIAPLLSLGIDLVAGKLLTGYRFSAQSMGELGAAGSPTRPLVVVLTLVASALLIAFGIGVWQASGTAILPRIVAGLILGHTVAGLVATLFFPNRFGVRPEFGTPGVLLMFLSVLCFVLAMGFGAAAFHGWMRILSIAIPAAYILLAVLRFATAASSAAGTAVLIGAQERTMAYSFLAWLIALSMYLLLLSGKAADSAAGIMGEIDEFSVDWITNALEHQYACALQAANLSNRMRAFASANGAVEAIQKWKQLILLLAGRS